MAECGKCKTEIGPEEKIFICPDCGADYHDNCHNLTHGLCPICTLCGISPIKQIEKLQFIEGNQITGLDPQVRDLNFGQIEVGNDPNTEFEQATNAEQIERIHEAIETSPSVRVSTSPSAKGKEWIVAFPMLICAYFAWQGLAHGDMVGIIIAAIIAIGSAIWWAKT